MQLATEQGPQHANHLDFFRAQPGLLAGLTERVILPAEREAFSRQWKGQPAWIRSSYAHDAKLRRAREFLLPQKWEYELLAFKNQAAFIVPSTLGKHPGKLLFWHGVKQDGGIQVSKRGKRTCFMIKANNGPSCRDQLSLFEPTPLVPSPVPHYCIVTDNRTPGWLRSYLAFAVDIKKSGRLLVVEDLIVLYDNTLELVNSRRNTRPRTSKIDVTIRKRTG